jgi:hypothetical protein
VLAVHSKTTGQYHHRNSAQGLRARLLVRERVFAMQFILKTTFLPRQARDKRRKSREKNTFLQGAAATTLEVVVQQHQRELPRGARLQDNAVHCEQGYV